MSNQDLESVKWSNSMLAKTVQALRDLGWSDPNQIQDIQGELKLARTTMLVNFGPEGNCRPGLVYSGDRLSTMIVEVFSYYEKTVSQQGKFCPECGAELIKDICKDVIQLHGMCFTVEILACPECGYVDDETQVY